MKWYSVLIIVFCLWYICFVCFCGILWNGVLWSSPLHYLLLFTNKFWIFLVPCNLEAKINAYPNILIFSCKCHRKQILLLWNFKFWLVLVSSDVPILLIFSLLVLPFSNCVTLHRLLLLLMMLQHIVVFCIQLISHHS